MATRLGLRTRLTIFVTLVFAAAISLTSVVVVVNVVEDDLVANSRTSAQTVLSAYLDSIYGGTATVEFVDARDSTQFFYLDDAGEELTEREYFDIIATGLDAEMTSVLVEPLFGGVVSTGVFAGPVNPPFGEIIVDPGSGQLVDATGATLSFIAGPQPIGEPHRIDVRDDVVAVAQTLTFTDGTTFDVGVSSPLQPVTDSINTIRRLLWFAVPTLILAIAAITWLAATRALRPVHAISRQARAISAANIDQRLPLPPANDEIRELADTVNDMLARLERSQQQQRQLVADASHELRSPVASTRAQLEVAQRNPEAADWEAMTTTVLGEQEQLSSLIDDLLALSRLDEAGPSRAKVVDLEDLIGAESNRGHGVRVRTAINAPVQVSGDEGLLTRAVRNLVDNATRHAKAEVLIALRATAMSAIIDVDDDGPGVPVSQRERIFDRFARIDEARDRVRGGAGLGLAITREVARAHGGEVEVTDSPMGGARFTVTLPLHR